MLMCAQDWGEWALMLLSLGTAALGLGALRRRRA
ncbi:MAG: IPTL-CTERM sorting domain-containing protein [Burkholderiaceae bacterium]|nr:MAG: IPTL-CTERM sorting domain-containing protein [Burkholderiaceae bacterium]